MKFAIFTHVEHFEQGGQYIAYAPYVREMNVWFCHVEEVEIIAPLEIPDGRDKGTRRRREKGIPYEHSKLTFTEVPSLNFLNFSSAVKATIKIPYIFFKMFGAMRRADHLHLRCPGNIGLLAVVAQIFLPSKPKSVKYAGNWDPDAKQPWTYKLQKWILRNTFLTRNMQVLVYGEWPGQSKNVVPFFTATFSEKRKAEVRGKDFSEPFTYLFVGNLVEGKRPLEAVKLIQELRDNCKPAGRGIRASLEIFGDGPERENLTEYVKEHGLEEMVSFHGSRPLEELKEAYQKAHFVILPSKSEGWPKAIAEGMFFGCIPIATPVSCVPWMLGYGSRGFLLSDSLLVAFQKSRQFEYPDEYRDVSRTGFSETPACRQGRLKVTEKERSEDITKIKDLLFDPEKMRTMSEATKEWSQQYTLEIFERAIKTVLEKSNEKSSSPSGRACRPWGGGRVG